MPQTPLTLYPPPPSPFAALRKPQMIDTRSSIDYSDNLLSLEGLEFLNGELGPVEYRNRSVHATLKIWPANNVGPG